ncbi:MAG: hypothetical protein LCH98_07755 [Actinobacteria bacterium]|nr:hypothetical protein [Actinomycetota bacterium]
MALAGWLDRVRHRPGALVLPAAADEQTARLVAAFRADPGATDLRPVTKAMTRDISGWILGHPAVRTVQDAWSLRAALIVSPDLQELMLVRLDAQRCLLAQALAEDSAVPPLYLVARLDTLLEGSIDGFLTLLPTGSVMQIDVTAAAHRMDLCRNAFARLRDFRVDTALTGLWADGTEEQIVQELAPDVLMLDVDAPLNYRDRLTQIGRLRAGAGPHRARIVMGSVASVVDEWAGTVCGADHLIGPLYDTEDLTALAHRVRETAAQDDKSPYEQAAAHYATSVATFRDVLARVATIADLVCASADKADVYLACRDVGGVPAEAARLVARMVDCGAAVTALAASFHGFDMPGLTCTTVPPNEALTDGWALVVLLPGVGHIVAGIDLGDSVTALDRRHSYVVAEDRELAVRIANRISQRAAERDSVVDV